MIPRTSFGLLRRYTTSSSGGGGGHGGGGTGRSSSVIASLLRLRQQHQRAGGDRSARGGSSGTTPSNLSLLSRDALRLLNSEARVADALSDVSKDNPLYGAEVGKLLAVAATFGGSTTHGRVEEALDWVTSHPHQLTTTRQVMSIAMPLLNLQDGAHAGAAYVLQTLVPLLLEALAREGHQRVGAACATTEKPVDDIHRQSLVAVISVFQLIEKVLSSDTAAATTASQVPAMVGLFEAASAALRRLSRSDASNDTQESVALELGDCVHPVEAFLALAKAVDEATADGVDAGQLACSLHGALRTDLLPALSTFLLGSEQARESGERHGRAGASLASPRATASSLRGTGDVVRLLQSVLALHQWSASLAAPTARASSSADAVHTLPLLASLLSLLPGAISAASARDMANAALAVTRVRQVTPALVAELRVVPLVVEAMRPKLFQLAGTHQSQLGALECSLLLANFSKWSGDGGTSAAIPEDLEEMLFARMAAQIRFAYAPQLVPLFESLVRFSRQPDDSTSRAAAETASAFFRRVPSAEVALRAAHHRVLELLRDEGKLSVADAAHILGSLAALRVADSLALEFFLVAEPLLRGGLAAHEASSSVSRSSSPSASAHERRTAAHVRTVALQALAAFLSTLDTMAPSDEEVRVRVIALRDGLLESAVADASAASSAKELVMLFSSLSPAMDAYGADPHQHHEEDTLSPEAVLTVEDVLADVTPAVGGEGGASLAGGSARWDPFVETVALRAVTCNAFEVSALLSAVTTIAKDPRRASARHLAAATEALLAQSAQPTLVWSLADAKRFMDAARSSAVTSRLSPVFFDKVSRLITAQTDALTTNAPPAEAAPRADGGLTWPTQVGRTLLSLLRRVVHATDDASSCRESVIACCAAFAGWCDALVNVSLDTHPRTSASEHVHQLCLMSFVLGQMKRLATQEWVATAARDNGGAAHKEEDATEEAEVMDSPEAVPAGGDALANLGRRVEDALLSIGDTIQLLLLRSADLAQLAHVDDPLDTVPTINDADTLEDTADVLDTDADNPVDNGGSLALRPKELIMLLQAFDAADVRHPTLFEDLLPSLVIAADFMDALELSLLLTSLAHLGVWHARAVVNQLAQRAVSKLTASSPSSPSGHGGASANDDACETRRAVLRQATGLLRALYQTHSLPATTFLTPTARQPAYTDWHTASVPDTERAVHNASDAAFVALAQAAVDNLDAHVRTQRALRHTRQSVPLRELVAVVHVLTDSHLLSPPQPTTDAYVVLAVKQLLQQRPAAHRVLTAWLHAVTDLLPRIHVLRRYDQRVATFKVISAAMRRAKKAVGAAPFAAGLEAQPTRALAQFLVASFAAETFYGGCARLSPMDARRAAQCLRTRWEAQLAATPASPFTLPRELLQGAEQCLLYLPAHRASVLVDMLVAPVAAMPTQSPPPLTTLIRQRESLNGFFLSLRVLNVAALSAHTHASAHDTVRCCLDGWLTSLCQHVPSTSIESTRAALCVVSPRQLATLWLSLALALHEGSGEQTVLLTVFSTLLPALQERLHVKEAQVQLPHAVDLLLGAAQLCTTTRGDPTPTTFDGLPTPLQMLVLSVAQLGASCVVRTLHTPEPTGLPRLYESHRLITAGDGCLIRWLGALDPRRSGCADDGRAVDAESENTSSQLHSMHRSLTQVLRWCGSCLHVAERGTPRQVKLSTATMKQTKAVIRRAAKPAS